MSVGLVIVAHSADLANGVVQLVGQMAPNVRVLAAGGMSGGGVGTDFEATSAALAEAESGSGVVLLYDLGSAQMTAELAVEALADPNSAIVVEAPLVEGAVAAAVAAQGGGDASEVARVAQEAFRGEQAEAEGPAAPTETGTEVRDELVLENEIGLHARPAALLARSLTGLDAEVTVSFGESTADARSVLAVMALGARKGDRVSLEATGPDAERAVGGIRELADRRFEE